MSACLFGQCVVQMGPMISLHVDLRMIEHARTLAGERSYAKAAKLLNLTQSALSRSILELEKRVGKKLFDRNIDGVLPTEVGRLFLSHADGLLAKASDMVRDLRQATQQTGELIKVGAGTYPTDMFIGQAVGSLTCSRPGIQIQIVHDQAALLIQKLRKRELDMLVGDATWVEGADDIKVIPLQTHSGCAVVRAGHPLLQKKSITLEDAIALPLVASERAASRLALLLSKAVNTQKAHELHARWMPVVTTESLSMMCSTVAASDAVTLLPIQLARAEQARGRLAILPLDLPWLKITFSVMHLAHRLLSPAGEAFLRAVQEADDRLLAEENQTVSPLRKPSSPDAGPELRPPYRKKRLLQKVG